MPTVNYAWSSVNGSFDFNSNYTTGSQDYAAVTSVNGGSKYFGVFFTPDGIVGRFFDNLGNALGGDFQVNLTFSGVQTDASVTQLTNGNIIVTYTDYSVDAGGDILARIVSSSGTLGAELPITTSTSDDSDSDITALTDGGFAISWTRDFGAGDLDVDVAIYNADGGFRTSFGADTAFDSASHSQVAGLANGNLVIVYEKEPAAGGDTETWFQIRNATTGAAIGSATLIDTFGSINEDIQVVALQDGGFAVAYTDNGWGIDQTEITMKVFNSDGSDRSGYVRVNTGTAGVQNNPTITTLSNGYIVVGWNNGDTLQYQTFTAAGAAVGANYDPVTLTVGAEVAGLSGGLLTNVRISTVSDGDGTSVRSSISAFTRTTDGDGTSEVLAGDSIRDVINGAGGLDIITGGLGDDRLTGGAGNDEFRDTTAGLNGDTIVDFTQGDSIHIVDANASIFTSYVTGNTLNFTGGSLNLENFSGGTFVASTVLGSGVNLTLLRQFGDASQATTTFGSNAGAGGWSSNDTYPRLAADVNGDGRADLVGFGSTGVQVSLAQPGGAFAPPVQASGEFGANPSAGGWTSDNIFPRMLGDVNGDHRADVIAFGSAGVYVALGQIGGTFAPAAFVRGEFGSSASAGGWANNDVFTRLIGDVNGDGRADIVGFGNAGVYVSLGQAGGGFGASAFVLPEFGYSASAGGWQSDNIYPRLLGDVNGDNRADIIAFGEAGVYVALGQIGGGFGASILALSEFGHGAGGGGWATNNNFPRLVGDINGDNFDDIVGFGSSGVYFALGNGDGTFDASRLDLRQFGASGAAGGWSTDNLFPRALADVDGDGSADIVGFASNGTYVAYSLGDIFHG